MIIENDKNELDHNLYSRQIGAFGLETMNKLMRMRVLQLGLSGVGLETAKNLILAGPKSLTIFDPAPLVRGDLEYNFFASETQVKSGLTRAQATVPRLAELNGYVDTSEALFAQPSELLAAHALDAFDLVIVTDWYPLDLVQQLNAKCHELNKGFILSLSAGLAGAIFVDFGSAHRVFDKNGEEPASVLISAIDEDGTVTTQEDKRHDLEEGDLVRFSEVVGMEQVNNVVLRVVKVLTPYTFSVGDLRPLGAKPYVRNGIVEQVKEVRELAYRPLSESLADSAENLIDCDMDFERLDRVPFWRALLHCFWKYADGAGFPRLLALDKLEGFEAFLRGHLEALGKGEAFAKFLDAELHRFFFALAAGNYAPVHSFFGGITAQEAVKFTGKFSPLSQWFVHEFYSTTFRGEAFEGLKPRAQELLEVPEERYASHVALLGRARNREMQNAQVFMIGAGALGCEYLKLFAMTGLGCGEGLVTVTDDDTIEVSNLNRQFLFRSRHVGLSKSETACAEVCLMNPGLRTEARKSRASPETEAIFPDAFWDAQTLVVNAVDNIKARQYVDAKAVLHWKPLFEAGTLGTKCNSQLVLPGLTECYNDSQDPQEKSVPMCTMRSFPFLIEHTIEWARARFFDLFVQPSKFLKEFFDDPVKGLENIEREMKNNMGGVKELVENLEHFVPLLEDPSPAAYIRFARDFYQHSFDAQIAELVRLFPADYRDKEGNLFWVSPKRPPHALPFDSNNPEHLAFIVTIVKILGQLLPPPQPLELDGPAFRALLAAYRPPPSKHTLSQSQVQAQGPAPEPLSPDDYQHIRELIGKLAKVAPAHPNLQVREIEFEKDVDGNGHIDFITFAANCRASNYCIPNAPRHKIKLIAGRIIPAIATTTALVVGAVGLEIYKHFLRVPFASTRNFFANLSLPVFVFSEPIPPLVQKDKDFDPILLGPVLTIPKNWNTWSRFEMHGPLSLDQVIADIRAKHGFTVSSVTAQGKQVWSSFSKHLDHRKSLPLEEVFRQMGLDLYLAKLYEVLSLSGETDDMVDVYCPVLKYHLALK